MSLIFFIVLTLFSDPITLTIDELSPLSYSGWKGEFVYLDSEDQQQKSIVAALNTRQYDDHTWYLEFSYPDPDHFWENMEKPLILSSDGTKISNMVIQHKSKDDQGNLIFQTTGKARWDGKYLETILTYHLGQNIFSIAKEVRYEDQEEYVQVSKYSFSR